MRYSRLLSLLFLGVLATQGAGSAAEPIFTAPVDLKALPLDAVRPQAVSQPAPVYPDNMSRAGLIGRVVVEFVINTEGRIINPVVVRSNNPWFERPAIAAVLQWRFKPGRINGRPINVRVSQLIIFELEGYAGVDLWKMNRTHADRGLPPELRVEKTPVPVSTAFPVYPFELLRTETKGKSRVSCIIDAGGWVIEAKVDEATAPEFGLAAQAMLETWRFQPACNLAGVAIPTTFVMEHEFTPTGRGDVPVSDEARDILRALKNKPETIATMKNLDSPLKPLSRRPPVFPVIQAKAGKDGEATIEFFVDENGDAQLPRIITSSAPEFGYAAVQAVATWRFEVPKKGGKPTVVRVQVPMAFSLPKHEEPASK